jgi:hypothetical protein
MRGSTVLPAFQQILFSLLVASCQASQWFAVVAALPWVITRQQIVVYASNDLRSEE